jgi:hypothetical protein
VHRRVCIAAIIGAFFAVSGASAQAQSATGEHQSHIHGIAFAHGSSRFGGGRVNNLTYHGGPVMQSGNTVYAIFWVPSGYSVSSGYQSVTNQYFTDVAAASGQASNVYWSDTQYSSIQYKSIFAGDAVPSGVSGSIDTDPYPASGCRDRYTSVCLTDAQLQAEIAKVASATGQSGLGYEYFVFTPRNVGSCFGSSCAYSYFCAYHSNFTASDGSEVLYANMPYAAYVPGACGSGQSPNGDDADSTLNVTSHEHNETITDPLGTAWYDSSGNENGDKCAWNFGSGSAIKGTSGAEYNQVINGHDYYLQQEWSNHSAGCVLTGT